MNLNIFEESPDEQLSFKYFQSIALVREIPHN